MMVQPVVSRSQRRIEKKQLASIVVLVLAVAGVSFFLGVLFGRSGGQLSTPAVEKPSLPMATRVDVPPPPVPQPAVEQPDKLTFYDNLPKGNQAPLGSGINLPPEKQVKTAAVKEPAPVKAPKPRKAELKKAAAPAVLSRGAFVVQVASFRTGEDAAKLASRLKKYNLTTFVESADLGAKGVWHRVLTGPYETRGKADQAAGLLREKERLSALVRQR